MINGENYTQTNTDLIKEMVIGRDCFYDSECNLVIDNYPNLEKILIKPNYLNKIKSLTICNNEKLKTIEVYDVREKDKNNGVFANVKSVILESIFFSFVRRVYIFPIYNPSKQEIIHSDIQQVYLYQV